MKLALSCRKPRTNFGHTPSLSSRARQQVASVVGVAWRGRLHQRRAKSNNLALLGLESGGARRKLRAVVTTIEHHAVPATDSRPRLAFHDRYEDESWLPGRSSQTITVLYGPFLRGRRVTTMNNGTGIQQPVRTIASRMNSGLSSCRHRTGHGEDRAAVSQAHRPHQRRWTPCRFTRARDWSADHPAAVAGPAAIEPLLLGGSRNSDSGPEPFPWH